MSTWIKTKIQPKTLPKKSAFSQKLDKLKAQAEARFNAKNASRFVSALKQGQPSMVSKARREARERAIAHIGPSKGSLTFDPFQAKRDAMARQASMAQTQKAPVSIAQSIPSVATAQSFAPSLPQMPSMDYEAPPVEAEESEEQPMGNKVLLLGGLAVLALLMLKKK